MEKKDLKKLPILEMLDYVVENKEVTNIIEAIRKERENQKTHFSESELLQERKKLLNKVSKKND
jgi:excinuclease UvrABC helicase subunit UvrB